MKLKELLAIFKINNTIKSAFSYTLFDKKIYY